MKKYFVALIDDDADDCEILETALRENYNDISLVSFDNGKAFLEFLDLTAVLPDLIVTDVYMPKMTGIEIVQRIKADSRTSSIPIAILSSIKIENAFPDDPGIEAIHYFVKPVHIIEYDTLTDRIMKILIPTPA
jgi:CheY-like chemotaxis protein